MKAKRFILTILLAMPALLADDCGECETCNDRYIACVAWCQAQGWGGLPHFTCQSQDGCAVVDVCECRGGHKIEDLLGEEYSYE